MAEQFHKAKRKDQGSRKPRRISEESRWTNDSGYVSQVNSAQVSPANSEPYGQVNSRKWQHREKGYSWRSQYSNYVCLAPDCSFNTRALGHLRSHLVDEHSPKTHTSVISPGGHFTDVKPPHPLPCSQKQVHDNSKASTAKHDVSPIHCEDSRSSDASQNHDQEAKLPVKSEDKAMNSERLG